MSNTTSCPICKRPRFNSAGVRRVPHEHECLTRVAPTCEPELDRRRAEVAISDLLLERETNEPTQTVYTYSEKICEEISDFLHR